MNSVPDKIPPFSTDFTIGILGGGQLGKMLLVEASRYSICTKVMDGSSEAPCKMGSSVFVKGDITDMQTVLDFATDCDVLTIEIENVNIRALHQLQREGKAVFPKPETLDIICNKIIQKNFYRNHNINTAPFWSFKNKKKLLKLIHSGKATLPFVWKAATGGYDGYGVQIVKENSQLNNLPDVEGLAEELISFEKELAVIVARSTEGEVKSYPVVEMDFHSVANLVEFVFSPSSVENELQQKAREIAENLVKRLNHVGLLAVEMFLAKSGEILVNEVAPRVHNSGHLSIEGNITSQFDQHLRAVLGLPLGATDVIRPAVMVNLNGEEGYDGSVFYVGIEKIMNFPGIYVHLYGKIETKPHRKMGHVTVTANALEEARILAREVKETVKVISK